MTLGQLVIAWVLARQPALVPVVGIKTVAQLDDALGALDRSLTAEELASLDVLVPPGAIAGDRYPTEQMRHLDSER
jgi:aryl-alcohol dehydrogenase-like predicted oxidoreductase